VKVDKIVVTLLHFSSQQSVCVLSLSWADRRASRRVRFLLASYTNHFPTKQKLVYRLSTVKIKRSGPAGPDATIYNGQDMKLFHNYRHQLNMTKGWLLHIW